jgi:hypothetical protein
VAADGTPHSGRGAHAQGSLAELAAVRRARSWRRTGGEARRERVEALGKEGKGICCVFPSHLCFGLTTAAELVADFRLGSGKTNCKRTMCMDFLCIYYIYKLIKF